MRLLGSKLMFIDIERDTRRMQIMVELKKLATEDGVEASYKSFKKLATKGDWIGMSRTQHTYYDITDILQASKEVPP